MRNRIRVLTFAALALICIGPRPAGSLASTVTLDVPDRADAFPWIAASGSFVGVAWGATGAGRTDVYFAGSRDRGTTFGPPVRVNRTAGEARLGGELPPRVELIRRQGSPLPEIAVLWTARAETTTIKVARSRDGGKSFDAPVTLNAPAAPGDRGWPSLAVDTRGAIHAIWLDHRGMAPNASGTASHEHKGEHDGVAMAQKSALYYASVDAKAASERALTNGVCYCCKTALAAGPSGALYAAWRHVYPGNLRDMAFAVSRDGGRSFSAPVRVSEDGWMINGCPDDGPAIAVDAHGVVHLAWPTVLQGPNPQGAIFYSSTRDGRRFTPRVRVPTLGSPKPEHPQIVIDGQGRIVIAWDELIKGESVAAARELRLQSNGRAAFGEVMTLSTNGAGTYPVLAAVDRNLVAVWTTGGEQSRVEVKSLPLR